jgi:hypothetical protein
LPTASIRTVGFWRYHFVRALLFPFHFIGWGAVMARAKELDERVREMAPRLGVRLIEHRGEWYGFDPIHIRKPYRKDAWNEIFGHWSCWKKIDGVCSPLEKPVTIWKLRPLERYLFGMHQLQAQPVYETERLKLSLY